MRAVRWRLGRVGVRRRWAVNGGVRSSSSGGGGGGLQRLRQALAEDEDTWWRDGLRFSCSGCGNCCTGPLGEVNFSATEGRSIAHFLG